MDAAVWLAFVAAAAVILVIPGPTVLLVTSYVLARGRGAALAMAAGVALGDFTAMTLSLAGLGAIITASATLFAVLKWLGAAYLLYLAVRMWRSAGIAPTERVGGPMRSTLAHAFVVTALNPKSIAFFVAFVPQFIDPVRPVLPQAAILEATFVSLAAANALGWALGAAWLGRRLATGGGARRLGRIGAATLAGLALFAATRKA